MSGFMEGMSGSLSFASDAGDPVSGNVSSSFASDFTIGDSPAAPLVPPFVWAAGLGLAGVYLFFKLKPRKRRKRRR